MLVLIISVRMSNFLAGLSLYLNYQKVITSRSVFNILC